MPDYYGNGLGNYGQFGGNGDFSGSGQNWGQYAGAAANIIGGVANIVGQNKMNKKQREFTERMYERQRLDNYLNWRLQNEYNAPTAQMERLKAAGLNPNLIYGSGAPTTAESIHNGSPGGWNPTPADYQAPGAAIGNALDRHYDIRMKNAQVSNMEKQGQLLDQDAKLKEIQQRSDEFDYQMKENLRNYTLQGAQVDYDTKLNRVSYEKNEEARRALQSTSNLQEAAERILKSKGERNLLPERKQYLQELIKSQKFEQAIKAFEIQLNTKGITKSDPAYARMFATFWEQIKAGGAAALNMIDSASY